MIDVGHDPALPYSGYNFRLATKRIPPNSPVLQEHLYTFKDRFNQKYMVLIEKYDHNIYILKFFLKNHINSEKRYQFLTQKRDVGRILATCIKIALEVLKEDTKASFGFLGMNSVGELKANTSRFRLYRRVASDFFSEESFDHRYNISKSTYALLNKKNQEPDLINKVENMFRYYYPLLEESSPLPPTSTIG